MSFPSGDYFSFIENGGLPFEADLQEQPQQQQQEQHGMQTNRMSQVDENSRDYSSVVEKNKTAENQKDYKELEMFYNDFVDKYVSYFWDETGFGTILNLFRMGTSEEITGNKPLEDTTDTVSLIAFWQYILRYAAVKDFYLGFASDHG